MDADGGEVVSDEIHCNVDKIGVMMTVSMVKELPLTVQFIDGGGATEEHVVSSIEPSTITVKGSAEDLEGLNSLNIAISIFPPFPPTPPILVTLAFVLPE